MDSEDDCAEGDSAFGFWVIHDFALDDGLLIALDDGEFIALGDRGVGGGGGRKSMFCS